MFPNTAFYIARLGITRMGYLHGVYDRGLEHDEAGAASLKYSHILLVDVHTDIRDGYSYGAVSGGDNIYVPGTSGTLFKVIFVELAGMATYKRAYLQRQSVAPGSVEV